MPQCSTPMCCVERPRGGGRSDEPVVPYARRLMPPINSTHLTFPFDFKNHSTRNSK